MATFSHVRSIPNACLNNALLPMNQKPFSQATAPHWPCPKLLLTPFWSESIAQSFVHIFSDLLSLCLLPSLYLQWSQQSHSLLSWEKMVGFFFFKNFYMHNIDSPRDELKNIYCKDLVAVLKWIFLGLSLGLYFSFLFTLSLSLSPAPTIFTPDITL